MAFDPISGNPTDYGLIPPVDPTVPNVNAGSGSVTDYSIGVGTNPSSGQQPYDPTSLPTLGLPELLGDFADTGTALLQLFSLVVKTVPQLGVAITDELQAPIGALINGLGAYARNIEFAVNHHNLLSWKTLAELSPTSALFKEMLRDGLGLHPDNWSDEAKGGIDTVDRMLTFAAMMPLIGAFIDLAGHIPLAGRWAKTIGEVFAKIPEEMGVSWAMGLTIDEAFKTAVGRTIEEEINKEKRPNRIDWPVLRQMFRQHIVSHDLLIALLKNNGFPDDQIQWILTLADVVIPIGDVQQLYLNGIYSKDDAHNAIKKNGFSDEDADNLFTLYIDKAETAASSVLRSTARELFRNYQLVESDYRGYLEEANFPKLEIDRDIEAINLEHKLGRINTSTTVVKQKYLHNQIDSNGAQQMLVRNGLTMEAAANMVASWDLTPIHPKHGLSQAKILSYYASNLLSRDQAGPMLLDTGLLPDTVTFLLEHPTAHGSVTLHRLSPGFVITAYLDGAIDETTLGPSFVKAGVAPDDLQKWIDVAHYRYLHRKTPIGPPTPLTKGDILAAYKKGIFDLPAALQRLETLQYTSDDATVLLEIEAGGPFGGLGGLSFTSIDDAIFYLQQRGFKIFNPPDPNIAAAEQVITNAGYTYEPPTAVIPAQPIGNVPPPPAINPPSILP